MPRPPAGVPTFDDQGRRVRVGNHVGQLRGDPVPVDRHHDQPGVNGGDGHLEELPAVAAHKAIVSPVVSPAARTAWNHAVDPFVEL